jgi:hypothetical protein
VSIPTLGPTQPLIQWVPGVLSPESKQPRHETDHSSPSSYDVNYAWSYTSAPPYVFTELYSVKHRDNFMLRISYKTVFDCLTDVSILKMDSPADRSHR